MRRPLTIAAAAAATLVLTAGPAAATHVHGKVLPSGQCVLLAADGAEKEVDLPNSDFGETRRHPLHDKVHLGVPGERQDIFVAIGDDGSYTAAAMELCGGEFLNG